MSLPPLVVHDAAVHEPVDDARDQPAAPRMYECDHCGRSCEGAPEGAGLFIWTRGDEVRYEEPPLCGDCAAKITIGAWFSWDFDEEEG